MEQVIGFVGPGALGAPAVLRLVAAGRTVQVAVRRPEARLEWAGRGVRVVDAPADAAEGADVLVVFVLSDEQVLEVLDGPDGALAHLRPGAVVVLHSTVSTRTLAHVVEVAGARGISVADAPVDGSPDDARAGTLVVLLGATDEVAERVGLVLHAYGDPVLRVGGVGAATRLKLVSNLALAANAQIAVAAVQAAEDFGLDRDAAISGLASTSGTSAALGILQLVGGDAQVLGATIGPYLRKDVAAGTASAADAGVVLDHLLRTVHAGPLDLLGRVPSPAGPEGAS